MRSFFIAASGSEAEPQSEEEEEEEEEGDDEDDDDERAAEEDWELPSALSDLGALAPTGSSVASIKSHEELLSTGASDTSAHGRMPGKASGLAVCSLSALLDNVVLWRYLARK